MSALNTNGADQHRSAPDSARDPQAPTFRWVTVSTVAMCSKNNKKYESKATAFEE
jgi:hypothetical protein